MTNINGLDWKKMLISGTNSLANNIERINALNVFPVPDGDTGSNMHATMEYATSEISSLNSDSIAEIATKFSRGSLLGARGNSGVIISQIFKGFSTSFEGKKTINNFELVAAFNSASSFAYKSVLKAVEGTMLTVIRMIAENLAKRITPLDSIEKVLELAVQFGREACDLTPSLLPILKEVGVTDSGGEGILLFISGMYSALIGKPVEKQSKQEEVKSFFTLDSNDWDNEYGYCTEFIMNLANPKNFNKAKFEKEVSKFGDSLVVVNDAELLKVHIHTENPIEVFAFANKLGEFIKIKSDNMSVQADETNKKASVLKENKNKGMINSVKTPIAVISCGNGQGIINEMIELGADFIIEIGEMMPSTKEFAEAVKEINSEKIIILPNNPNIVMAAQQVAQTTKKEVIVIPSKTQIEGLAALMHFDVDTPLSENRQQMSSAIDNVATGQITKCSKTTEFDGVKVREGEYLEIAGKKILGSNKSKVKTASNVIAKMINDEVELILIYYGQDATEADAMEVATFIENNYPVVDVEVKEGGQQLYNFLIAFYKEFKWE